MLSAIVNKWSTIGVLPEVDVDAVVKGIGSCGCCTTGGSMGIFLLVLGSYYFCQLQFMTVTSVSSCMTSS